MRCKRRRPRPIDAMICVHVFKPDMHVVRIGEARWLFELPYSITVPEEVELVVLYSVLRMNRYLLAAWID